MYMPYPPLQDDRGNLSMDMCVKTDESFFEAIEALAAYVQKAIHKRVVDHQWLGPLREDPVRLKIRGITSNEIESYDYACKPLPFAKLHKEDSLRLLLHVKYVWIDPQSKTYGLKLQPLQIQKVDPPILQGCMFQDQHANFYKMLKAGIPKEAIAHKMQLEGIAVPPDLRPPASAISDAAPRRSLPPPPPRLPPPPPPKQPRTPERAFKPPSIDMLLQAKSGLRSTKNVP